MRPSWPVRSIRHGSEEWSLLIKPFVADLAFRCLQNEWSQETDVCFRPYTCHAAVLFIDLSGYSSITAALVHRGAHFLSGAVNSYLEKILRIIQVNGGDVVKFAGDAVVAVWEGYEDTIGETVLCAAKCAFEIQTKEPSYTVMEATETSPALLFRTHCGITCGLIDSEVFRATTHEHMQQFYHSVGGDPLARIGEVVDTAKAGEICVDKDCYTIIGTSGRFRDVPNSPHLKILQSFDLEGSLRPILEEHVENLIEDRQSIRQKRIEEKFIHPKVLRLLSHGGLNPTQIAQIRNICVLFIAMTSNGSSVNWLMEVQSILDRNRCPIVQIIDDDKGVVRLDLLSLSD